MLWIATAAMLAVSAPEEPVAPERQARATVRIVSFARVELGQGATSTESEAIVRESQVRDRDGTAQRAILVEFS